MLWDEILHEASFDGVRFPVTRRTVRGGRRFARHTRVYQDGQETEDTGRKAYVFDLEIPIYNGVDGVEYPTLSDQLRAVLDDPDTKGEGEYVDHILGPVNVKVADWSEEDDAQKRDGTYLKLTLEERSNDAQVLRILADIDPRAAAESLADAVDIALGSLGVSEEAVLSDWASAGVGLSGEDLEFPTGSLFLTIVDNFFATIETGAMAADEIAAVVDAHRSRLDRLLNFSPVREVSGWSATVSIQRLADSMSQGAERVFDSAPPIVEWVVPAPMSHFEIAGYLYGDPRRADEIVRRNPVRYPLFYTPGRTIHVLAS